MVFWRAKQSWVEGKKLSLAGIDFKLDEERFKLEDNIRLWRNTRILIEKNESIEGVLERIDELTFLMDSINQLIIEKSNFVLNMLIRVTAVDVEIKDLITNIEKAIILKKERIFERNQPSLFAVDYSDKSRWNFNKPILQFYESDIKELDRYMNQHIPNVVFHLLLLALLIYAFISIKRRLQPEDFESASVYKKVLFRIFYKPVSVAVLMGLFASILIFDNRPPAFKDLFAIVTTIPLVIILFSVASKKRRIYTWLFGLVMFLRLMYLIFPPENVFYRFSLLTIAIIEIFAIIKLLRSFFRHPVKSRLLNNLIIILLFLHFGSALTGLISIVFGSTMLAEITLSLTIVNVFAGFLLIISAFTINGLVEVAIDSKSFQRINVFRLHARKIKKRTTDLINVAAILYWLYTMMRVANIARPVVDWISEFFAREWTIGSASFSLGGIFTFFFILWLSMFLSKIVRVILEEDVLYKLHLGKGVPRTISVVARFTLVTMGVMLALSALGISLTSLTVLFGAFGVGIGFGLQSIFNNLVSGLILLFERPIQIGDTIEVGTLIGNVKSMGIRASHVRTFDGAEVIVPNGQLISNEVVNWTLSDQRRRIEILLGVAYGSDPYLVKKLLLTVLDGNENVLTDPEPIALFNDLGESSMQFRLLFWTSDFADWINIRSNIIFKVYDALEKNNISIAFPQREVHVRSGDQSSIHPPPKTL